MTQKLIKPITSVQKVENKSLFFGIWIRWGALTAAERLVCAFIILIPVLWVIGIIQYLLEVTTIGILVYEWRHHRRLRLKRPSLVVIALFASFLYGYVDTFLLYFDAYPSIDLPPGVVVKFTDLIKLPLALSLPFIVWYIQSNDVRIRLEAVAWACSVSIVQMLVFWVVIQFIFPTALDPPPLTLYARLTGKAEYLKGSGSGKGNYLLYYDEETSRHQFFFTHYHACAAYVGFVGLLALDIKNRFWSLLLLGACIFLLVVSATRAVWVAFPVVVFIRFLLITGKVAGAWFLFALLGIASFVTLSLSPVTDLVLNTFTDTSTSVNNVRPESSKVRSEIYKQTLEEIPDKLLFGHKSEGRSVTGNNGNRLGSHSKILGELYQGGLLASGIFVTYWASLIFWFYNTRAGRPMCWIPLILLLSLISSVALFEWTVPLCILACMMLRRPGVKSLSGNAA